MRKSADRLRTVFRRGLLGLTVFTFIVDLLLFVQPVYMLQVYDRVLASGSVETLVFISLIAGAALVLLGVVDAVRGMMAVRIAAQMEVEIGGDTLTAAINSPRAGLGDVQPLRDLATVRGFISGRAILSYLDLPFAPLFIALLYLIHPHLFWMTVLGAAILTLLALLNQAATSRQSSVAAERGMSAMLSAQAFARSAESIYAMGMAGNVIGAWGRDEAASLQAQDGVGRTNAIFAGLSRVIRLGLQIAILGYGGYLVIDGQMTGGMIFASSLISGRGLQPIDQVIGNWRGFVDFRKAWKRLTGALDTNAADRATTELPAPAGRLTIDQLVVFPPNAAPGSGSEPLLKRISAVIQPGECVAVIGQSGAGKSTLARAVVGALPPRAGAIRIDGADIRTWDRERLGRHYGYLAQEVDLLPGTIAANIARFSPEARGEDIVAAAKKAKVHDLILGLANGYDTVIGPAGQQLSGGQRQRIGLARAFYGSPRLLVLDEPNANLDAEGDLALERALEQARGDGVTVMIVTQRRPIADKADKIMILRDGAIEDFGPRAEVFARQAQKAAALQARRKPALVPPPPSGEAAALRAVPTDAPPFPDARTAGE